MEGIRFLDVRLAEKNGRLIAYHGILSQRADFEDLLKMVTSFLARPESSRETVIMSIQQENAATPAFLSLLRAFIEATGGHALWHLANRVPTLGEARGKIVLFSRFGGDGTGWDDLGGMGLHPIGWRDSVRDGFELELPKGWRRPGEGWTLAVHDWYNIGSFLSIPEKAASVLSFLSSQSPQAKHIPLAFCSASSFPLACPVTVARGYGLSWWGLGVAGVNARVGAALLDRLAGERGAMGEKSVALDSLADSEAVSTADTTRDGARGWILLDFFRSEPGLVELIIAFNFLPSRGSHLLSSSSHVVEKDVIA